MKNIFTILVSIVLFFLISTGSYSQVMYYSAGTGGLWNLASTWSLTPGGAGGAGVPTATDDAIILAGAPVTVPFFTNNNTCRNLYIDPTSPGTALTFGFFSSVTITGTLCGWQGIPVTSLIGGFGGTMIFTGANLNTTIYPQFLNNEIIGLWSSASPLPLSTFNLAGNARIDFIVTGGGQPDNIDFASNLTINSGTLSLGTFMSNLVISGSPATININSGATLQSNVTNEIQVTGFGTIFNINQGGSLIANGPFNGGSSTSSISTLYVDGTLNAASYVNANSFSLDSAGQLLTAFNGTNQTQGWWYQTTAPTTYNISGLVDYKSTQNQNVALLPSGYVDLTFSGGGIKTFAGASSHDINGDFQIGSAVSVNENGQPITLAGNFTNNSATWGPTVTMIFDGTSNQLITGISPISFNSTVRVANNSRAGVTLGQHITINGTLDVDPGAVFFPIGQNVTITGDVIADGNLRAGIEPSTFIFDGSTNINGKSASFYNITINSSNSLTAPAADTIRIAGNFANNGTFNSNNGTVIFNGAADQSITESQLIDFNNIEINNTNNSTVNVNGDVDLSGTLKMATSSARFDADGSGSGIFTVTSKGLNRDARIDILSAPANFVGNVSVERYVDGVSDVNNNWRYLATPTTGANVAMWQDDFPVTGNFSNPSTTSPETPIIDPNAASIYYWDGAGAPFWYTVGSGASTGSTSLEHGRGYSAYTYRTSDFTVTTRGNIGSGGVSKSITANAWALMGNPYPSTIDWDNMSTTGLYASVYIKNVDGSYATYVKGGSSGANHPNSSWLGEISMGQSFWIYSEGATTINFTESNKTASPNYQFLKEGDPEDLIRITLSSDIQDDEILIRFGGDFLDEFQSQEDAIKFRNGDYQSDIGIYSYINLSSYIVDPEVSMTINSIPFAEECNKRVYLKIEDVIEGEHKLNFTNIEAFNMGYDISLIDNFTNNITPVEENTEYLFQVTSDSASFGNSRFEVQFDANIVERSYDFYTNSECTQTYVTVTVDNAVAGTVYQVVKGGEVIGDPITAEGGQVDLPISKEQLTIGETLFDLNTSIGSCEKFLEEAFIVQYDSIYAVTEVVDGSNCGPGQVILQASGAPIDGFYRWYEYEEDTDPIPNETGSELILQELNETKTYYVAAVNTTGCESLLRRPVKGIIADVPNSTPVTDQVETTCINNSTNLQAAGVPPGGHYVWYDGNENIFEDETDSVFVTPILSDTSIFYVAFANELGCIGEKTLIEVPVLVIDVPVITEDKGVLNSSYENGNQWFKDGIEIEGATSQNYDTHLEGGLYTVQYSDGSCDVMSEPIEIEGVTGLDDFEESDLIKLFPNPASDHLYVEYNVASQEKVRLLVYSSSGRLVDSNYMDIFTNGHKIALDITSYSKGMYITVVYDGENYVYSKFSKQ